MGESSKAKTFKKAQLSWACQFATIERVRAGDFTLGDRSTTSLPKQGHRDLLKDQIMADSSKTDLEKRFLIHLIDRSSVVSSLCPRLKITVDEENQTILLSTDQSFIRSLLYRAVAFTNGLDQFEDQETLYQVRVLS
jgi:hypothetical protein